MRQVARRKPFQFFCMAKGVRVPEKSAAVRYWSRGSSGNASSSYLHDGQTVSEGGRGGNCPRQAAIDVLPGAVKGQIRIRIIFRGQRKMNIVTAGAEKRERQAKAVTGGGFGQSAPESATSNASDVVRIDKLEEPREQPG